MPRPKYLSLEEIEKIIEEWPDSSEDDLNSDEDVEIFLQQDDCNSQVNLHENNNHIVEELDIRNIPIVLADQINIQGAVIFENMESGEVMQYEETGAISRQPNVENEVKQLREKFKKLIWKNVPLNRDKTAINFNGDVQITQKIQSCETPLSMFNLYFDDEMIDLIIEQSNLYSSQKNISNSFVLTKDDLKKFLGVCVISSIHQLPNTELYWDSEVGNKIIQDAMSFKTFKKIKSSIHFVNNESALPKTHPQHDRLFKLRPFLNVLQNKFALMPLEEHLSVDEQICATKIRSYMKQYVPSKPHKWGFKIFALTGGTSGYMYNFEVYSGQENSYRLSEEENLGASANIVVRLCRSIPRNMNHKVFCDNYFTTIPLILSLQKEGIHCIGTIRRNRIPNSKLRTEREISKLPRGSYEEYSSTFEDTDLSLIQWKDNKPVTLVSSYVGANPVSTIKRWDNKKHSEIFIQCPEIIKEYNRHMGGVDLHDSFIGRYRIKFKSSKWYHRIFFHMLDVSIVNSWIAYKKVCDKQQAMTLCDYRINLGKSLCVVGSGKHTRYNSSSSRQLTQALTIKSRKRSAQNIPIKDIRLDNINHFPIWDKRTRCKMLQCNSQTYIKCSKCGVSLCVNSARNCFNDFHK